MVKLIDTNILIRFLTSDHKEQALFSKGVIEDIKNRKIEAIIHSVIISEALYVMEGAYRFERGHCASLLEAFFLLEGVINEDKHIIRSALILYRETGLDYADCILISMARIMRYELISFDKKMLRTFSS